MEEKKLVPKLRFPGFTEPWEQRKFGELFLERREKTTEENEDILLSCAITGIYLNSDLFSHFRGSSTVGYLKVRKNDLILSAQNLHLGNANINFNFEHGMISPAYKVFEIESCDPYFVNAWVKKDSTKIFFLKVTTEGASQCRKNIDWDALINQDLLTPNAFEQEAIGKFFYQLDRYITLHQRKLEHLKLKKKSLLQKLFPKEGEVYPELRFPGFTDPWEQRKLADILSRRKENRCIDSAYPRLAFAAGQGVIPLSERRTNNRDQLISDEKNKKYLVTYYNDIVYNPANLKYGAIDRNKYGQGVISPIYVTFTSNICSGFVEHIVKSHEFKEKVLSFEEGTVTKRQAVNPDNLLKIDVVITSNSKEQEKISKLFELIDRFITLHQRKLEHLQLLKKALLQQLFV